MKIERSTVGQAKRDVEIEPDVSTTKTRSEEDENKSREKLEILGTFFRLVL